MTSQNLKLACIIFLGLSVVAIVLTEDTQPPKSAEQPEAIAQSSTPDTPAEQPEPEPEQAEEVVEPVNPIVAAEGMYPTGEPPAINPPSIDDPDRLVALMVEADRPAAAQPGEWMVRGDRAIAVTGNGEVEKIQWSDEAIEGRIVFVTLMMQNHSAETGNFGFSTFEVKDSQGRTYAENDDTAYVMWRNDAGFQGRTADYYPGETRKDVAAFIVAPDASGLSLNWREGSIPLP